MGLDSIAVLDTKLSKLLLRQNQYVKHYEYINIMSLRQVSFVLCGFCNVKHLGML